MRVGGWPDCEMVDKQRDPALTSTFMLAMLGTAMFLPSKGWPCKYAAMPHAGTAVLVEGREGGRARAARAAIVIFVFVVDFGNRLIVVCKYCSYVVE